MSPLPENLVLKVVSEIHDPVTTTDELIPSGETSSFRSNPLGLAEFALSRKDPEYVGRAKEIQKAQKALEAGNCPVEAVPELAESLFEAAGAYVVYIEVVHILEQRLQIGFQTVYVRVPQGGESGAVSYYRTPHQFVNGLRANFCHNCIQLLGEH